MYKTSKCNKQRLFTCDARLRAEGKHQNFVRMWCVRPQNEVSVYPYELQYTEPNCLDSDSQQNGIAENALLPAYWFISHNPFNSEKFYATNFLPWYGPLPKITSILIFIGPCIILIVEWGETNLMSLALLFLYLMHNMFRMLIHPSWEACDLFVELLYGLYCSGSMCVGVTLWYGCGGVVSVYHTTIATPQRNSNTHRTRAIQPMK